MDLDNDYKSKKLSPYNAWDDDGSKSLHVNLNVWELPV